MEPKVRCLTIRHRDVISEYNGPMNRVALLARLAHAERHIRDGERHLSRQREIVAELELHGRGHTRTAQMARDILDTFEMAQSKHLNDRAHFLQALREIA
jgi:hypothetical protein